MWGAGMGWFPHLLDGGSTRVTEIHNVRNPLFPDMKRPEPIPPNIARLQETVVKESAHVGIVNDGDADRVGLVDEHGVFVDQLRVYALLAFYLLEVRGWRGAIVKTLSTTSMLEKLGQLYDVPVYNTGVGFKYVAPKMLETDAMIGGEESGGYALRGHVPERDGILIGLLLLDMMVQTGKSPAQLVDWLFSKVGPHYYDRVDRQLPPDKAAAIRAHIAANPPKTIDGSTVVDIWSEDGFKFTLDDGSWLLIRFSGTEPIIRVYTETTAADRVPRILAEGLRLAGLT
jgi:phosphomannomutase